MHCVFCALNDIVCDGSGGAIYRRWMTGIYYNDEISMSIDVQRWVQVKRVKNLQNIDTEIRGEEVYNTL